MEFEIHSSSQQQQLRNTNYLFNVNKTRTWQSFCHWKNEISGIIDNLCALKDETVTFDIIVATLNMFVLFASGIAKNNNNKGLKRDYVVIGRKFINKPLDKRKENL